MGAPALLRPPVSRLSVTPAVPVSMQRPSLCGQPRNGGARRRGVIDGLLRTPGRSGGGMKAFRKRPL